MPKCAVCGRFSLLAAAVYHCADCGNPVCRPSHSDCGAIVEWAERKVGSIAGGFVYKDPKVRCRHCLTRRAADHARAALSVWTVCPRCGSQLVMSHTVTGLRCSQRDCPWHPQDIEQFAVHAARGRDLVRAGNVPDAAREYQMAGLFTEAGRLRRASYEGHEDLASGKGQEEVNEVLRQLALRASIGATVGCPHCQGRIGIWGIQGAAHRCPHCGMQLRVADLLDELRALL